MAGELTRIETPWVTVGTTLSLPADTFVQANSSSFATLMAAQGHNYLEFEALLQVVAGSPAENDNVEVHLRIGDGALQEPAPDGDFAPHLIGGIVLDNQTGNYYADGFPVLSKDSQIYLKSPTTITATLSIRAKTLAPAV